MIGFSAVGTVDPDGDTITMLWTSDRDGEIGTQVAFETQLSEGWHNITLTVTDEHGVQDTVAVEVEVRPYLPHLFVQEFGYDLAPMIEGDVLHFSGKVANDGEADGLGAIVLIQVDGVEVYNDTVTVAIGGNVTFAYDWAAVTGGHTVRVEVGGDLTHISINIAANTLPQADPVIQDIENRTEFNLDEVLSFLAQASDADGDDMTFEWDFGDGTAKVTTRDASHAFTEPGTYTATLNVTDARGGMTTWTMQVYVKKPKQEETPGFGAAVALCALTTALVAVARRR